MARSRFGVIEEAGVENCFPVGWFRVDRVYMHSMWVVVVDCPFEKMVEAKHVKGVRKGVGIDTTEVRRKRNSDTDADRDVQKHD